MNWIGIVAKERGTRTLRQKTNCDRTQSHHFLPDFFAGTILPRAETGEVCAGAAVAFAVDREVVPPPVVFFEPIEEKIEGEGSVVRRWRQYRRA
jgi:hypothetical protein